MNGFTALLLLLSLFMFGVQDARAQDSTDSRDEFSIRKTDHPSLPDRLQFAPLPEGMDIEAPPFGFGIAISTYDPDVSGLQTAYDAIAERLGSPENPVRKQEARMDISLLVNFNLWFRVTSRFALSLETEFTVIPPDFSSVSLSGLYRFISSEQQLVKPYARLGIGYYYMKLVTEYGDRIGTEAYLQDITTTGGSFGSNIGAGCELSNNTLGASAQVDYMYVPELIASRDANGNSLPRASVDLSSLRYSVRILFYF